ncbi:hypothetical protein ACIBQ8_17695, partial [Nonomuraea sp. NPDC049646]
MSEVPTGRGSFIVVGMVSYDHHDNLEHVRHLVPTLCETLSAGGFNHELPSLAYGGTHARVLELLGNGPEESDALVIYWAGHGVRRPAGEFLLVQDSPEEESRINASNAISANALVTLLVTWHFRYAVIVLDTCYSGASAQEVTQAVGKALVELTTPEGRPAVSVISSCGPYEQTQDGHFIERFVDVLRGGGTGHAWAPGNERVKPEEVLEAVVMGQTTEPTAHFWTDGLQHRVFLNPRAVPGLPTADAHTQIQRQRRILDLGLKDHFREAARGVEVDETGWFFFGRTLLLADLVFWLREGPPGLRVVTGSPGAGKSAVLGRIATLSDPAYRRIAEAEGALADAEADTIPPVGLIDVAIHAKNKSLAQCQDVLAAGLGIATPAGGWRAGKELMESVQRLGRRVRVIVDALDEARPDSVLAIVTDLIRPLTALPEAQVVVGTRAHIAGKEPAGGMVGQGPLLELLDPGQENVHILDSDPGTEAAIAAYVKRRLTTATSPYSTDAQGAETVAHAVAKASGQVFLFARIVAHALAARATRLDLGSAEAADYLHGQVQDVFARDLARFGPDEIRVRELLTPLAWAEGAGFPRQLWALAATALATPGTTYGVEDVDWLLDHAGYHVSQSSEDGQAVYRLYHQAFADYFKRRSMNERKIQRAITDALLRSVAPSAEQSGEGPPRRDWADADPYVLRHLAAHAAPAERLGEVSGEPGYLAYADSERLIEVLGAVNSCRHAQTQVYWRAAHNLAMASPDERAGILRLTALAYAPHIASVFPPTHRLVLRPRWAHVMPSAFHRTLTGHNDAVNAISFGTLPDGTPLLATGSHDGTVRLWDPTTGLTSGSLTGHTSTISAVAFGTLPDGTLLLATGSHDGTVRLWDPTTGLTSGSLTGHTSTISAVAFGTLPDGTLLLATGSHDGTVRLWDPTTGLTSGSLTGHTSTISAVAFGTLPDGTPLLATGSHDGQVRLWDPATGQQLTTPTGHNNKVSAVAFGTLPDGTPLLATGSHDGTVRLWDPTTGLTSGSLTGHTSTISAVAFGTLPDGTLLLATGSHDGTVRLWNPATGAHHTTLTGSASPVHAIAFGTLPDGVPLLATGSHDGTVRLWNSATDTHHTTMTGHTGPVSALAFTIVPDGTSMLATGSHDHTVRLWDSTSVTSADGPPDHTSGVSAVVFGTLEDGASILATNSQDGGAVRLWDPVTGRRHTTLTGHTSLVYAIAFATLPDGTPLLATGSRDGRVRLWDPTTGHRRATLTGNTSPVYAIAFATLPDGTPLLATGSRDGRVRLWDPTNGSAVGSLTGHTSAVSAIAFATLPDGTPLLATGSRDGRVRLWDPTNGS